MAVKVAEPNGMAAIKKPSLVGKTVTQAVEEDQSLLESFVK